MSEPRILTIAELEERAGIIEMAHDLGEPGIYADWLDENDWPQAANVRGWDRVSDELPGIARHMAATAKGKLFTIDSAGFLYRV